ncbi:MAG: cation transporter [Oscillospiraceae bacterium]|nr:cation transporter [Oscillospiraceae bacterium]
MKRKSTEFDKTELFARMPVGKALRIMSVPMIISQLISVIYNAVDAFFIGRTGNSIMIAATTITLSMVLINIALANLFGIGGGSLVARLMGADKAGEAKSVSAFSVFGTICAGLLYALLIGLFTDPVLRFLGASDDTIVYARVYARIVVVCGCTPTILSMVLAHLLRNVGFSREASIGLSGGGILNVLLDPLFMFVIMPKGQEVTGAAIATLLSNCISCAYLIIAYLRASTNTPLSFSLKAARQISKENRKSLFAVGVPSAALLALFDVGSICVNILAASHGDLVLAGMGIVLKIERIPNGINVGICQGMQPIVSYNYASGDHERMRETIAKGRRTGLIVSLLCVVFLEVLARPVCRVFLSTSAGDAESALTAVAFAVLFLRIRCLASPMQFLNYHSSYCMQSMGDGRDTILHAFIREIVFYIPLMFLLNRLFGEIGLSAALPVGEALGALFALWLLKRFLKKNGTGQRLRTDG